MIYKYMYYSQPNKFLEKARDDLNLRKFRQRRSVGERTDLIGKVELDAGDILALEFWREYL